MVPGLKSRARGADHLHLHIGRTPGIADPSGEQVLFSTVVLNRLAYLGEGERIDEAGFSSSLCGCFQLRGLGFGFFTRGSRPRLDGDGERHRSRVETSVRSAASEGLRHVLLDVVGGLPVYLVRERFFSLYRKQERLGKQMLRHPASFTVPWPALVRAEYSSPLEITSSAGRHLLDPLLLSEEHDGSLRTRVLLLERDEEAAEPGLPVARLFEQRARFEQLVVTLTLLASSLDGNGNGSKPFNFVKAWNLARDWFGSDRATALDSLISDLGADLTGDQVTTEAAQWLARYPIAAALDRHVAPSNDLAGVKPPAEGWPFIEAVTHATLAPWPEQL